MPLLLVGAGLLALPVVLHLLLKQEPKRLPFPAIRFLKLTQKTSQRRLQLRHWLLLALRVLLLAAVCAALFQPVVSLKSTALSGIGLESGQPVAAVLVIDTTPSMGYTVEGRTRLADAVRRAVEFLDALPETSRVAVATTADPSLSWELSKADARRRLESLKSPDGAGRPVTGVLRSVYPFLSAAERDGGSLPGSGDEALPKVVAVFGDRAQASFAADAAAELVAARDAVPGGVAQLYFDVGVETPVNVSVLAAQVSPPVVPAGSPATVTATVRSTGSDIAAAFVRLTIEGQAPLRQEVRLVAGVPAALTFRLPALPAGVYQGEVALETPDALGPEGSPGFDNVRYVSFRVGAQRKLLAVSDDPASVRLWRLAIQFKGDFACEAATPANLPELAGYEGVCVIGVRDPAGAGVWAKLKPYVERGGRVLVAPPPASGINLAAYTPDGSGGLLPGALTRVADFAALPAPKSGEDDPRDGPAWRLDDAALGHPLLAPLKPLVLQGDIDFLINPRRSRRVWEVDPAPDSVVVARYAEPAGRPAILERAFPGSGRVVLATTRFDDPPRDLAERWNNYFETSESSFGSYFPNLFAQYLAGGESGAVNYQFATGQAVALPLPRTTATATQVLSLEGPGVRGDEALRPDGATLNLPPTRTAAPGNYRLRGTSPAFEEPFSLDIDAGESELAKVPAEAVEALFGPESVLGAGKSFDLAKFVQSSRGEVALFPWLVGLIFVLFLAEGLFANRFYRGANRPAR